jgi:tetratricopeptide (TPR) repeat protein
MGKIFVSQKNPEMYVEYFTKALQADSNYAPALYEMYYHYYFIDAQKAMDFFKQYMTKCDDNANNHYLYTDLLYLNKQYEAAINNAQQFPEKTRDSMPRLYKLLAYCYAAQKDTATALANMSKYFAKEPDSNLVAKDFETMASLYAATPGKEDSALAYYIKTVDKIKDSNTIYSYYKKLADTYKGRKDYSGQALWLGKYYMGNSKAGNVDLFNWGIAHIKAAEYTQADTVFGRYIEKYPEQSFGYYWRARANSLQDTSMEKGLAVPWYTRLADILEKDTTGKANKKWQIEAYGYLAAYETNTEKDYKSAIEKLKKILEIDPGNKDAQQYISVLEKKVSSEKDTSSNTRNSSSK